MNLNSLFFACLFTQFAGNLQAQDVELAGLANGVRPSAADFGALAANRDATPVVTDGGWHRRARAVAAARDARRATSVEGGFAVNSFGELAVSGDLRFPLIPFLFANTDSASVVSYASSSALQLRFFSTSPAPPYSITTYYQEMSSGLLNVAGQVFDWVRIAEADTTIEAECNALFCEEAKLGLASVIRQTVAATDARVDYSSFDNDGPDNIPNSGDDDGIVDVFVLMHPELDGSCGTTNVWAHRSRYQNLGPDPGRPQAMLETANIGISGAPILIDDYIIQGGQGGATGCLPDRPQAISLIAHELGHTLGLPDLYDVTFSTHGIGRWGLMGKGIWHVPERPVALSAWSRARLGWITEVVVGATADLVISPVETSDTAYVIPVANSDEYFLLSNRQPIGADSSLVMGGKTNHPLGPGLLIWHVDTSLVNQRIEANTVNVGEVHAIELESATGRDIFQITTGDGQDPYPGLLESRQFSRISDPTSDRNDGALTDIRVSEIEQSGLDINLRAEFGKPVIVTTSSPRCVKFPGASCGRYFASFTVGEATRNDFYEQHHEPGSVLRVSMDSIQMWDSSRVVWQAWSDGGTREHDITVSGVSDSIMGFVRKDFIGTLEVTGAGSVLTPPTLRNDTVRAGGREVIWLSDGDNQLLAVPDPGHRFVEWIWKRRAGLPGRIFRTPRITLGGTQTTLPWGDLTVRFIPQFAIQVAVDTAVWGTEYRDTLTTLGGEGTINWTVSKGQLPPGVDLDESGVLSGVPEMHGRFTFTVFVTSDRESAEVPVVVHVRTRGYSPADVARRVLGIGPPLAADDAKFLDFVGNKNGSLDIGDFLAWTDKRP